VSSPPERPFPTSLCHRCVHLRTVGAKRSVFLMCEAPGLPKYRGQPVATCAGFVPLPSGGA
jgi:hypothetical protein